MINTNAGLFLQENSPALFYLTLGDQHCSRVEKTLDLVCCQDLKFGSCATASESSETQCLPFFRGNRRALGDRRRSSSGTRIFRFDKALRSRRNLDWENGTRPFLIRKLLKIVSVDRLGIDVENRSRKSFEARTKVCGGLYGNIIH